jgi:aryl-alcohol dehydrogenase-like predicted oxidoreductase
MGGLAEVGGKPIGWSPADDAESLRVFHRARELGVNFYDTADVYGFGHSEELLGRAFSENWQKKYVAAKVGTLLKRDWLEKIRGLHARNFDLSPAA